MTVTRSLAIGSLLTVAACASNPQTGQAPRPARGEDGPGATISVSYTGGIITREVTASFTVSRPSFVVVAHLGGDGMIRVLYPSIPNQFEVTDPGHRYRTEPFSAGYDGAPSLHTFALSPYRTAGARYDSYDGRGYGFVFIVATQYPMRMDSFRDGFDWFDLDVQDYFRTSDPRVAIQEFAERLAGGRAYTLKFARSLTTQNYSGYASNAYDCAVLSSLGHLYHHTFWNSWGVFGPRVSMFDDLSSRNIYPYSSNFRPGCGPRHYASYNGWGPTYNPYTPYTPGPFGTPPVGPITPVLTRPTARGFGERVADVTKTQLTRSANAARAAGASNDDVRSRANAARAARAAYEDVQSRNDNRGASEIRRDVNRGRSVNHDPPSTSWAGGARAASDRTHTVNGSSGGGGGSTYTPPPPPPPAPTTPNPTASQPATTKIKN